MTSDYSHRADTGDGVGPEISAASLGRPRSAAGQVRPDVRVEAFAGGGRMQETGRARRSLRTRPKTIRDSDACFKARWGDTRRIPS